MTNRPGKKTKNYRRQKERAVEDIVSIVGPDYIQLLQGELLDKNVCLVLCGESHKDAIDVTRKGGIVDAKEGWIDLENNIGNFLLQFYCNDGGVGSEDNDKKEDSLSIRILAQAKKIQPLGKSMEWAKHLVESDLDAAINVVPVLLWIQEMNTERGKCKGRAFVLGLTSKYDVDDDDEDFQHWKSLEDLPVEIRDWIKQEDLNITTTTLNPYRAFQWGDLDTEAFQLNKRRLTEEKISTTELDEIICKRKIERRMQNIWTWDDWFDHIRKDATAVSDNIEVQLVLESSVPPWELDLYRPSASATDNEKITLPTANDCIRQVPEDEESGIEDDFDPSSDGVGSYLDYIYRRFVKEMIQESNDSKCSDDNGYIPFSGWVHCVDMRELGCEASCCEDSIKKRWKSMLTEDERKALELLDTNGKNLASRSLELDSMNRDYKFLPENMMNPERIELEQMRSSGMLIDEEDPKENDSEESELTLPSFEGFFGQISDFLYYSPHVKLVYAPFLAKCVKSFSNLEHFFKLLFFGGTIPDSLALLDLNHSKDYLYVRSPILKLWNEENSLYEYRFRDDGGHYITYPFFPFIFHLCAKGSSPPRTWSSHLFTKLCDQGPAQKRLALVAQEWILETIRRQSADPKMNDDPQAGGEWFEAFLRASRRDIYDDIDLFDSSILLRKNKVKSLTSNRKYDIGKIKIPSCKEGFQEILDRFTVELDEKTETIVTPRVEVMAKIMIDIWMSNLIDYATVLKVSELVSKSDKRKVVIVCYMGSAHTRAVADFYVNRMKFKKKAFLGKVAWDEDEQCTMKLTKPLWNIADLFR